MTADATIRSSTTIASVHGELPRHRYRQQDITEAFARAGRLKGRRRELLDQFHAASRVEFRNLTLPLDAYAGLDFDSANEAFISTAIELGERAVSSALERAGLTPRDVDLLMTTTVTGVATPSIDARLANRLELRPDVKRVPIFGLGCVGGAAGIARVHDYLRAWPTHVAVLLSVELCSLTLQRDDPSLANLIAIGLFGDAAAAVVAVGAERAGDLPASMRRGPAVTATRSRFYPDTERVMGWNVGAGGFRIVLSADVPELVERHLREDVTGFLDDHGLGVDDIATWVCHSGGPKVLDAVTRSLDLPADALDLTWESLQRHGNLSSASVLYVLRDTIEARRGQPGAPGLLLAMGPGFCSELVLLRW